MSLITNDKNELSTINTEDTYKEIRCFIINAKQEIYKSVNSAMVEAYWNIGKKIYEVCGENDRAEYGKQVLKDISKALTNEFDQGFSVQNLRNMRQFYMKFQKRYTLCSELSWSHYRLLMRINDEKARQFYIDECIKSA